MATQAFRLRAIMKQGTAASPPETWEHYRSTEDGRAGAKLMYHNDRVLRVMLVTDSAGTFVEWMIAIRCSDAFRPSTRLGELGHYRPGPIDG